MEFLETLHGEIRWLIALVAVIAIVKFAVGWLRRSNYDERIDRGLMTGFTVLMDINVTLGIILIVTLGVTQSFWPGYRFEHALTMIIAAVIAHTSIAWRNSPDDTKKYRNNLLAVLGALLFVFIGVMRLRGGWIWA